MPVADFFSKRSPAHSLRWPPVARAVFFATLACFWLSPLSSVAGPQAVSPDLEFDLAPNQESGLLDPELPFEFSVRLKGIKPKRDEGLVAVFESLAYPHRLVAFVSEESSTDLVASTKFESRPIAAGAGQPLRMEVVVARLRGMRLETVFSRAAYLTTVPAASAPAAPAGGQPAPAHGTALLEALLEEAPATDRGGRPVEPILLPDQIVVEELAGGSRTVPGPVYWKNVSDAVARHWQQRRAQLRKDRAARSLRVQFRLYPQGFVQLVQVERSSGDPIVDEAGLHTVLSLNPFPPFPPDVRDPSVDVHVDLPGAKN